MNSFGARSVCLAGLLAGLLLRAAIPVGYMPAAAGSGLLFELCPDQLPPGVTLPALSAADGHHHHDHHAGDGEGGVDQCQIGHLLLSAFAVDSSTPDEQVSSPAPLSPLASADVNVAQPRIAFRPRAPPA